MRIRSVTATILSVVLLGACARNAPRAGDESIAALQSPTRAERDQVDRWVTRKQMCRELGVRFDSSGLCW